MRRPARFASILLLCVASGAWARPPLPAEFDAFRFLDPKPEIPVPEPAARTPAGGEDFTTPILVPDLPFEDTNSTCGFADDVTPGCTALGGAPDVVYAFTPLVDGCVDIDLCQSEYDTALHVYAGGPGLPVACNDDATCGSGSQIENLELEAGQTYYLVVDGWSNGCGSFVLRVHPCLPACPVPEPFGAVPEGEPVCADGYYDHYNTGCNDFPYSFTTIPCEGDTLSIRGTYGTWMYGREEFRDTDWYQVVLRHPTQFDWRVVGGAPTQIAILEGSRACPDYDLVCGSLFGPPCEPLHCQVNVPPGIYWFFVAPRYFTGVSCGTAYTFSLFGNPCPPVEVEATAWDHVKMRYR